MFAINPVSGILGNLWIGIWETPGLEHKKLGYKRKHFGVSLKVFK